MAILPSVARSSRNATWRTGVSRRLDHCVSLGLKEPSEATLTLSGSATALPDPLSSSQKVAATAATTQQPATSRRYRLGRASRDGAGESTIRLRVPQNERPRWQPMSVGAKLHPPHYVYLTAGR